MTDLVFVSMENWDRVWRRNQFLCAGLARRHPESKILFVGLPEDVSHAVRSGNRVGRHPLLSPVADLPNVLVTRPVKLAPNTLAAGRALNAAMFRAHVQRATRAARLRDYTLWLNPHTAVHMVGRMGEESVVYDITDDWIEAAPTVSERRIIEQQDHRLCAEADAVIVCSQRLYELKRDLARNLHLVPNGVDLLHYDGIADGRVPPHRDTEGWPRPVLGYTGTLHPERVDIDLVCRLANDFPCGTIALVGPQHLPAADMATLKAIGNIRLTGPVTYDDIPAYMAAFDVCITPHRVTAFTESLNPIKLWEYLACGKPIVSTPVAGFRDYAELIHLAGSSDEFAAACRCALREPDANVQRRKCVATQNSWDARVDSVSRILERQA